MQLQSTMFFAQHRRSGILAMMLALLTLQAGAQTVEPTSDSFYQVPGNIASYANGAIVGGRVRSVDTLVPNSKAFQVFYKTTSQDSDASPADGTVATIWVPSTPASPPKILSYQYAEDADNLDCAPSWAYVNNSPSNNSGEAKLEAPIVVGWALSQGYYVVSPDAEGSRSAWLVGKIEGQACLDGIRATKNQFNLGSDTTVALYGYSGAAHTTVWASTLAAKYAPDLKIVGAAYGGTPIDLRAAFNLLNGGSMANLGFAAVFGLSNGYTALNNYLNGQYTSLGQAYATQYRKNDFCPSTGPQPIPNNITDPTIVKSNVLAPGTELSAVLARESLLTNVSSQLPIPVPTFPRFEYHGTSDNTVPYAPEAQYVQQQCAANKGANIAFNSIIGADHAVAAILGLPSALAFVQEAFQGTTPKVNCGTTIPSMPLNSTAAQQLLGKAFVQILEDAYQLLTGKPCC